MRPLLFIHGYGCDHHDWDLQIAYYASRYRVVTLDLPGHGDSPGRAECSIEDCAREVGAALAGLDLRNAVLISHSLGCRVALQAGLDSLDRVARIVLIDGSSFAGAGAEVADATRRHIATIGAAAFVRSMLEGAMLPADRLGPVLERGSRVDPRVAATLFPNMIDWDVRAMTGALERLNERLLVIQSTYLNAARQRVRLTRADERTPWLDQVRRHAPRSRIEVITGAGHFPQLETPQRVHQAIDAFLAI